MTCKPRIATSLLAVSMIGAALSTGCNTSPPNVAPPAPGSAAIVTVTADSFDSIVLASDQPVVVDLWAPWCGPCRQMEPILEAAAEDYAGRAIVAKVNIDEHPEIAQRYSVSAIPTLLFFQNGDRVDRLVGVQPKSAIAAKVDQLLATNEF